MFLKSIKIDKRPSKIIFNVLFIVNCFLLFTSISFAGEQYQYFLDVNDLLDPEWVYVDVGRKVSKIECASICFQDEDDCTYFGFKDSDCYLLKDTVDRTSCSQEDCSNDGMKIYKLKKEIPETTTSAVSTTTEGGFTCDIAKKGAEAKLECPANTFLLKQMGSRMVFFSDVTGATCSKIDEVMYEDEAKEYVFFSTDGGLSVYADCKEDNYIIVSFTLCVINAHVPVILLECHKIKDPDRIVETYNASSDDITPNHLNVNCGDDNDVGMQRIYFMDAGDAMITKVVFACVKFKVEKKSPPTVPPVEDAPVG